MSFLNYNKKAFDEVKGFFIIYYILICLIL